MAGLIGIFAMRPLTEEERSAARRAAQGLDFTGASRFDVWEDEHLCVCRVHHDHDPPPPVLLDRDRDKCVILDGEIFDVEDLRAAGAMPPAAAAPRGQEAARCLDLLEGGENGLAQLNGTFTLLVYGLRARTLTIASDRFGSRPLCYHAGPRCLAFGTQASGLLEFPGVPRRLDPIGAKQFFVFQTILDDRTFLADLRTLPPASVLRYPSPAPGPVRYWNLSYQPDDGTPEGRHAEALADALGKAIHRHTRDSKNLALLLSGGLDSRAIVACAPAPFPAVTIADFDNSEVRLSRAIAAARGFPFTFLRRSPDHYVDLVDTGVALGDGAYRFDNAHFAWLRGTVADHVTALVSGYGFDWLLKGDALPRRRLHLRGWPLNKQVLLPLSDETSDSELVDALLTTLIDCVWTQAPIPGLFQAAQRDSLEAEIRDVLSGVLRRATAHAPTAVQRYEYVPLNMGATRFTAYLNVLSVRHFFRDHTVVFDNAILDQVLRIPPRLRLGGHIYKQALRRLCPDLFLIPDANTGLRPDTHFLAAHARARARLTAERLGLRKRVVLPDPVFTQGSWPNMTELIRHRPGLAGRLAHVIADPLAIPPDLFDPKAVHGLLNAHLERKGDFTWTLLLVLTFGTWHRRTFGGTPR